MNKFRAVAGALMGVLLLGTGYVAGQDTAPKRSEKQAEWMLQMALAEAENRLFALDPKGQKDKASAVDRAAALYTKGASGAELSEAALQYVVMEYYSLRCGARSAAQVSQAADEASVRLGLLQAAQNQRILELLEKLAAKK